MDFGQLKTTSRNKTLYRKAQEGKVNNKARVYSKKTFTYADTNN